MFGFVYKKKFQSTSCFPERLLVLSVGFEVCVPTAALGKLLVADITFVRFFPRMRSVRKHVPYCLVFTKQSIFFPCVQSEKI